VRVVAIIQARMGSTRLPGKVLKDLCGETVLARVVNRTRGAKLVDEIVVATTVASADEAIVQECERLSVACFRGDEDDVLDRYYLAAHKFAANAVVRITSDCPLTDPALIDEHVHRMLDCWAEVDFVTNMARQSFPLGLAVEVMPFDVLWRMKRMSPTNELKEHVTTLAYAAPSLFRIDNIAHSEDLSYLRWTVDTKEDLELVRLIFHHFGHDRFSWLDVLALIEQHPGWTTINQHVQQKTI
jgi:spore coat polysaccharide biosynthesis protein SpsF